MPAMPRAKSKATSIAYDILGMPSNIASKKTKKQKEIDRKLSVQNESRIK